MNQSSLRDVDLPIELLHEEAIKEDRHRLAMHYNQKAYDGVENRGLAHVVFQIGEEPVYIEFSSHRTFYAWAARNSREYIGAYHNRHPMDPSDAPD